MHNRNSVAVAAAVRGRGIEIPFPPSLFYFFSSLKRHCGPDVILTNNTERERRHKNATQRGVSAVSCWNFARFFFFFIIFNFFIIIIIIIIIIIVHHDLLIIPRHEIWQKVQSFNNFFSFLNMIFPLFQKVVIIVPVNDRQSGPSDPSPPFEVFLISTPASQQVREWWALHTTALATTNRVERNVGLAGISLSLSLPLSLSSLSCMSPGSCISSSSSNSRRLLLL